MGKTHEEQLVLTLKLAAAKKHVMIGARYTHHKGADKIYTVLGLGFVEADNELCVIYQAEYGERLTFLRPLSVWLENVEWQGAVVPRFSKLES